MGEGDAGEFIERLQRIYLRANADRKATTPSGTRPVMALVTVGHSFGGQVLIKTLSHALENDLEERAPRMASTTQEEAAPAAPTSIRVPIDSFGDANILLNPATEAAQFIRIHNLYRQLSYPACQMPQLIIFSADNDYRARVSFPSPAR